MTRDLLAEFNEDMLFADGFDEALIGCGERMGVCVAIYSISKCIEVLMKDNMTDEEAMEYFEYNVLGSYMGENTPMFCTLLDELQ